MTTCVKCGKPALFSYALLGEGKVEHILCDVPTMHLFGKSRAGLKDRKTLVVTVCGEDVRKRETTDTLDHTTCRRCRKVIDDKMRKEAGA